SGTRLCGGPSCSNTENNGVRLRLCGSCKATYYCSAQCQRNHWSEHKIFCLEQASRRAAELSECVALEQTYSLWRKAIGSFLYTWICVHALGVNKYPENIPTKFVLLTIRKREESGTPPLSAFEYQSIEVFDRQKLDEALGENPMEVHNHMTESDILAKRHGHVGAALLVTKVIGEQNLIRATPVVLTVEDLGQAEEEKWEAMAEVMINEGINVRRENARIANMKY
ncbi:hypothetical protein B0H14DRAFT_2725651, partial [Mycena olivaceomarginata]